MQEELVFDLENPIKVQMNVDGKNEFVDIDKIYLQAPTYKHKDITIVLKKKFIEAIFAMTSSVSQEDAQKTIGEGDSKDLDEKAIKAVIYAAKDFDISSFFKKFESLFLKVAFKDEEQKQTLKGLDIEKMNENDFESLVAKYIEVFFIVSWMKTLS